jgi:hypothetical protein
MFMHFTPIGLADGKPGAEPAMFGKPAGATSIKSVIDTADPATLIRNALMAQYDQNAAVVLSGPATDLAALLDLYGVKDWLARKVRLLCVAEAGMEADTAAARKVFADWPTPIVTVGREIAEPSHWDFHRARIRCAPLLREADDPSGAPTTHKKWAKGKCS